MASARVGATCVRSPGLFPRASSPPAVPWRLAPPGWLVALSPVIWPLAPMIAENTRDQGEDAAPIARDAAPGQSGRLAGGEITPGSAPEYERFVREHERPVLNYLWRMTGDEQAAYDLTQETFLRAWRHFATVRGYERPRAWLFHVATNLALTHARRATVRAGREVVLDEDRDPAASDPAWRLAERDLVRETLLRLPPQRRAALVLREVYGLPLAEVARALGVRAPAARMALHRGRVQFRALYLGAQAHERSTEGKGGAGDGH